MADSKVAPRPAPPSGALPSSFDSNPEFFEESRSAKLFRRLRQEPLVPLGCAATCYAFFQAAQSIRSGDSHRANRMFRARVCAQGFTLVAIVGGSMFWKDDRMKRKELEKAVEEKKAAENKEKWLKELEARDREDREWRAKFEGVAQRAKEAEESVKNQYNLVLGVRSQRTQKTDEGAEKQKAVLKEEVLKDKVLKDKIPKEESKQDVDEKGKEDQKGRKEVQQGGKEDERRVTDESFQTKGILEQVRRIRGHPRSWRLEEARRVP